MANRETLGQTSVYLIQKGPANQSSWIECTWPDAPVITHPISIVLCKHHIVAIHRLRYINMSARAASMSGIDEIGNDTREHHLTKPFVALAGATRALRSCGSS